MNKPNNVERLGNLETAFALSQKAVSDELHEIRITLRAIEGRQSKSGETNWFLVIAIMGMAVTLVGALWASAIRPINQDIERAQRDASTLATAVVTKGELIARQESDLVRLKSQVDVLSGQFRDVYDHGSPITDKRLALIEYRLANIK
jgi:hypothetical protein